MVTLWVINLTDGRCSARVGLEDRRMGCEPELFHLVDWSECEGFHILFELTLNPRAQPSPHVRLAAPHSLKPPLLLLFCSTQQQPSSPRGAPFPFLPHNGPIGRALLFRQQAMTNRSPHATSPDRIPDRHNWPNDDDRKPSVRSEERSGLTKKSGPSCRRR